MEAAVWVIFISIGIPIMINAIRGLIILNEEEKRNCEKDRLPCRPDGRPSGP